MAKKALPPGHARKGDIVALCVKCTTYFINPYRSETKEEWTLVYVASATRDGDVTAIKHPHYEIGPQKLARMSGSPGIQTLQDYQEPAARLIGTRTKFDWQGWESAESLKNAILAQCRGLQA